MTGSGSIGRLDEMPGLSSRRGKMLGGKASWGKWAHALGRSAAFWKRETCRLYVQAKLVEAGALSAGRLRPAVDLLLEDGFRGDRELLTGVGNAARRSRGRRVPAGGRQTPFRRSRGGALPNGWRTRSVGMPRSTVYFSARGSEKVKARSYCRNLKTKQGPPFGRFVWRRRRRSILRLLARSIDPRRCGGLAISVWQPWRRGRAPGSGSPGDRTRT